ncbi:hypothetical protein A6M21_01535 [Desulfotomaculum copahuensis]|uniref:Uncharacterized protein n=1 Tax=Desulfotomaculum copahuensis TaxID=1838280 RepID=A0A1B7LAR6_9FIRM|nr:hypothetical protein A6M21_01535 [Desulfotomaculum copahuensis]
MKAKAEKEGPQGPSFFDLKQPFLPASDVPCSSWGISSGKQNKTGAFSKRTGGANRAPENITGLRGGGILEL